MLESMLATSSVDLIMATVWVGGLTLFLIGRAVVSWTRFRRTSNFAVYARLLSDATRSTATEPEAGPGHGEVVAFPTRPMVPERSASEG